MTALEKPESVSVRDYLTGEEVASQKHEYIGGVIYAMAGATNRHNRISSNCLVSLGSRLRGKPCEPFNSDTKVRIELADHTRFYYPDAMVVCHPNPAADHFQDQPVIIIEVLSESTRRVDLQEKRAAYLTIPSLKVLILVESDQPLVLVHRRGAESDFASESYAGLEAVIPLPEIGAELPLAELYERAQFPTI